MDGVTCFGVLLAVGMGSGGFIGVGVLVLIGGLILYSYFSDIRKLRESDSSREAFSRLPTIYYVLAVFCGVVLMGFTVVNFENFSVVETGAWVGYTVGTVLSMLTVGRVIQLLQQIRDAVRNNPALSPGRSDDE